ncbi:MAG: UDP-3-O-(3-hydroxymyristoyl)glucosamine N-acyltransferase [Candidatus Omnitrophota bacterium]
MDKIKEIRLRDLAKELNGDLIGDGDLTVKKISDIEEASVGDLVFILNKKFEALLNDTKATCAVIPADIKTAPIPVIKCKNPNLAFKKAVELLLPEHVNHPLGIHPTAIIEENVALGKNVYIGAYAIACEGSRVGDNTVVYPHSYIGRSTVVGDDCVIYTNVSIGDGVTIGSRVIINPGCVIGGEGFGYERAETGFEKIPHIGDVVIEDDVELGSCVTIDRAKIAHTRIGRGTKIDNLVQIAHNVTIGQNCVIVAQCGISGSVKIGNNVMMGGNAGIADHIEIGDNVMIAAKAGVMKSVPSNTVMWGVPARPLMKAKKIYALFDKLPELYQRLKEVEKKLASK